jgi:hypothetical protein
MRSPWVTFISVPDIHIKLFEHISSRMLPRNSPYESHRFCVIEAVFCY